MPLECEQLPGEPIVIFYFLPPSEPLLEAPQMQRCLRQAQRSKGGTVYFISDFSQSDLSFGDLTLGMAEVSQKVILDPDAPPYRPVLVGTSEIVHLMSKAAAQKQYGAQNVPCFSTLDEAVAYLRSLIAAE